VDRVTRTYRLSEPDHEIPTLDAEAHQRMAIRLNMFGAHEVQFSFKRCADAHARWSGSHHVLEEARSRNSQIARGELPASEAVESG
jgi:hypothetical protein